uniref:PfkB family carbohydrate kinase n=1 Tax=Klebsiella pneumoniae TaxID=573 RepID=UPI0022BA00AA
LAALFETEDFDAAADRLAAMVEIAAVTRGPDGSVIISGTDRVKVSAVADVKVVDTTGAGDQYAAGFLLGLARGLPLDDAGKLGSLAAAEVIAHWGPRPMVSLEKLAKDAGLRLA